MQKVPDHIFKAYDIRGIYPADIDEKKIELIIKGIYTFFVKDLKKKKLTVVLGRDMRISSPSLFQVAKRTLTRMGATVFDVGLVSTPTFYFAILDSKSDVGIQISASHNPPQYTGVKFAKRVKDKLFKISKVTGMEEVKRIVTESDFYQAVKKGEIIAKKDILTKEVKEALKSIPFPKLKKFKIVADPANAMGILFLEELFRRIPADLIKMNFTLDGTFPAHQPDPLEFKNLKELQKRVLKEKADFGIAPDGDGDRVFFIDEKGKVIPATLISTLIAKEILAENPGEKIIVDIRYTRNVINMVKKLGGIPAVSVVGHALITEKLNRESAIFAGESSGHFYFREIGGAESSIRVILYILKALIEEKKPISQIVSAYKSTVESGEFNFILKAGSIAKDLLLKISENYKSGKVSWIDGLSVDFPEWRFNIRTSNTEPLLRLNVEGDTDQIVGEKVLELKTQILRSGAKQKH